MTGEEEDKIEEIKSKHVKIGLNQDMLIKFNKLYINKSNANEIQGPAPYSSSNLQYVSSGLKTARPKKTTKLMPSKKYLADFSQIKILLKTSQEYEEVKYVHSQVTLSKDIFEDRDSDCHETLSNLTKMPSLCDSQPTKPTSKNVSTASNQKKLVGAKVFQTDLKEEKEETTCSKKNASMTETANLKEGYETPRSNLSKVNNGNSESPAEFKEVNQELSSSVKEEIEDEINFEVIMHILFEESRHLSKKPQPNKVIRISIADVKLAEFLEKNPKQIRGCRI